ncbi:hypothetical protein [Nostoc sp. NOS(2021)]|nr:hypothetical protein [Nostoc sp. NOS(2021)]
MRSLRASDETALAGILPSFRPTVGASSQRLFLPDGEIFMD